MRKLIIIILSLASLRLTAAPKLTVFIVVDGLDVQSMQDMRLYWTQGGLRTLSEEAWQMSVNFPQLVYGGDETTATILTGKTPFYHSYQADTYFRRADRTLCPMLADASQTGIHSSETLSPAPLSSATLADLHRLSHGQQAKIYAVGVSPAATILLAGHAANACCWLESTGWGTTTYYAKGLPSAADNMNTRGTFAETIGRTWTNRMDMASYQRPTAQEQKKNGFSYECSRQLRRTPVANTLVINLALELQQTEQLGKRGAADMLLLHLTLLSPKTQTARIASAEQEDMYISLNNDLGYLMEQLEKRVGKAELQLIVVGKPCYGYSTDQLSAAGLMPTTFNIDRAAALTGTYLMAMYGHERWVDGGCGNTIFLNRTLIDQRKLSLSTIRRQVADFLEEMEGVQKAFPITDVPLLQGNGEIARLRHSTGQHAGDVVVMLEETCVLMQNDKQVLDHVIGQDPQVPLLYWSGAYRSFPDLPSPLPATEILNLVIQ